MYIYRERERCVHIYIYIYICIVSVALNHDGGRAVLVVPPVALAGRLWHRDYSIISYDSIETIL